MSNSAYFNAIPKTFFLFAILLLLQGCGYRNPYTVDESAEGKDIGRVSLHVVMWKNRTGELGYQAEIHEKLIYWLNKSPNWDIIEDSDQTDYILNGVIQSVDFPGLSYDSFENIRELRAEIQFSYEVKARRSDEIILEQHDLIKRETFPVSGSAAATEGAKRSALSQIADDIADEIYIRLFHAIAARQ